MECTNRKNSCGITAVANFLKLYFGDGESDDGEEKRRMYESEKSSGKKAWEKIQKKKEYEEMTRFFSPKLEKTGVCMFE